MASRKVISTAREAISAALAPRRVPVRPIVAIASDDWGRSGVPSKSAVESLVVRPGAWDLYGRESSEDVQELADTLLGVRDRDGRAACMTAHMVMANLDIEATLAAAANATGGRIVIDGLPLIPISVGFPDDDRDNPLAAYKLAAATGAFRPELHGLTHFCTSVMAEGLFDSGEFGRRVRGLLARGIPYLASTTPELNFALVDRRNGVEAAIDPSAQENWFRHAVAIFEEVFGRRPAAFCAPGYRFDRETLKLLAAHGIRSNQTCKGNGLRLSDYVISVDRNVVLEPLLNSDGAEAVVERALRESRAAAAKGQPIVVCSHSINYIDRFNGRAEEGRRVLGLYLTRLLEDLPDLRFSSVPELVDAWSCGNPDWFKATGTRGHLARGSTVAG